MEEEQNESPKEGAKQATSHSDTNKNPLHGKTLEMILNHLVEEYGWEYLGQKINIRCFNNTPSIKSSLTFLRKTPWAREKVEKLYLYSLDKD